MARFIMPLHQTFLMAVAKTVEMCHNSFMTMINLITPAVWLLEKYEHPFYVVYINMPGEIVYEDEYGHRRPTITQRMSNQTSECAR